MDKLWYIQTMQYYLITSKVHALSSHGENFTLQSEKEANLKKASIPTIERSETVETAITGCQEKGKRGMNR